MEIKNGKREEKYITLHKMRNAICVKIEQFYEKHLICLKSN